MWLSAVAMLCGGGAVAVAVQSRCCAVRSWWT